MLHELYKYSIIKLCQNYEVIYIPDVFDSAAEKVICNNDYIEKAKGAE